jgi:Archease protein family (MTH1598/TM1083)
MKLFSPPPRSGDGRQAPPPKSRSNRLAKQGLDEVSAAFAADVDYTGDRPINSIRPDPVSPVGDPHMTDGLHATTRGRPNRAADGFELLDHPGDVKLRTWGIDLERFFANAVEGMMTFLFGNGIANLQPDRTEAIEIETRDPSRRLVIGAPVSRDVRVPRPHWISCTRADQNQTEGHRCGCGRRGGGGYQGRYASRALSPRVRRRVGSGHCVRHVEKKPCAR